MISREIYPHGPYTIYCDSCTEYIETHRDTPKYAVEYAAAKGWKIVSNWNGYKDLCPVCAKDSNELNNLQH